MKGNTLFKLFIVIAVAYLAGTSLSSDIRFDFYLKPLLLLPLILWAMTARRVQYRNYLVAALLFCWLGDIFLLFAGISEIYFVIGLSAFLIGHLFYIFLFRKLMVVSGRKSSRNIGLLIGILIYLIAFIGRMYPYLGTMFLPVLVYAIVIGTMFYFAGATARTFAFKKYGLLLMAGALSFVLSDSILAVNKFYTPLQMSGLLIMLTYIFAQGTIVFACIRDSQSKYPS